MLLDEFTALGRIPIIAEAISYLPGYNVRVVLVIQTPAQLREVYGIHNAETMLKSLAARIVFAPKDFCRRARDLRRARVYDGAEPAASPSPSGSPSTARAAAPAARASANSAARCSCRRRSRSWGPKRRSSSTRAYARSGAARSATSATAVSRPASAAPGWPGARSTSGRATSETGGARTGSPPSLAADPRGDSSAGVGAPGRNDCHRRVCPRANRSGCGAHRYVEAGGFCGRLLTHQARRYGRPLCRGGRDRCHGGYVLDHTGRAA